MIGKVFDERYKIISLLGKGGMGEVYQAADQKTGMTVAIKLLDYQLTANLDSLERFRREAETLHQLNHPNVVKFIDSFEFEGQFMIVMEYLSGSSLKDLINKGSLSIDKSLQIALELCDALIRSHNLGIVHRDLKPENVLLTEDGKPKLADFGVARLSEGTRMTQAGSQIGTPYYMAPEAWAGKPLDKQADIWSMGVLLFEMLTGKVPFTGDTPLVVMSQVSSKPLPDITKLRSDIPPYIVKIIKRMLTRDIQKRYKTIRQVAVDLERKQATPAPLNIRWLTLSILSIAGLIGIGFLLVNFLELNSVEKIFTPTALSTANLSNTESTPDLLLETNTPFFTQTATVIPNQITDSEGIVMHLIPEGSFTMGSDDGNQDEKPIHQINLDAYYIDIYEVTNTEYKKCVEDGDCTIPTNLASYNDTTYTNHPVVYVTWNMAKDYCEWRNARLPTEAEWEKAARGTDRRIYPWGNDFPNSEFLNFNLGIEDTQEIGTYENGISPYGIYDMGGNAMEWVSSLYQSYPYNQNDGRENTDISGLRVRRGGAWTSLVNNARTSYRSSLDSSLSSNNLGFRCAINASP